MSKEVKRYSYGYVDDGNGNRYLGLIEKPDGNLVKHEDYEALLAERDRLQEEVTEMDALRDKLSGLLSKTAVALRGPEPELTRYGYADIPLRVKTVIDERDQLSAEAEALRALLNKSLPVVEAHAGASHMLDGFRPARNKWDDLVDGIRAAIAAKEA